MNIYKVRKKIGLSATKFAKYIGSNTASIYNWEHGRTHPSNPQMKYRIEALYTLFNILSENPDWLCEKLKDNNEISAEF